MEFVRRRRCGNPCVALILSILLTLSPALLVRSSRVQGQDPSLTNSGVRHQSESAFHSFSSRDKSRSGRVGKLGRNVEQESSVNDLKFEFFSGQGQSDANEYIGGFEVPLLHRHHPDSAGGGVKLSPGEYLVDRIKLDRRRQMMQNEDLRAKLSHRFPELTGNTSDPGHFIFSTPEVSGFSLGPGQYFIDFYLGTPAQKFSLIADTGSDALWLQCTPCSSDCYRQVGPLFAPADSSTYMPLNCTSETCQYVPPTLTSTCNPAAPGVCDYMIGYTDGSQSIGIFATETATMNVSKVGGKNVRIPGIAFGCGFNNSGPSFLAADGIIGLGQGFLSFPSQIGSYIKDKFTYCLVSHLDAPTVSSKFYFGNIGGKAKLKAMFTPFIPNPYAPSLYYVAVQHVTVGGHKLAIPPAVWEISSIGNGGTVVDSGTTLTIFLEAAYLVILTAFQSQVTCYPHIVAPPQTGLDFCFNTSNAADPSNVDSLKLPSFTVQFKNGAVFNPPNANIYLPFPQDVVCLGMLGSLGSYGVFGNLIQQNFQVTYDRRHQQFGFAPADCASL